MSCAGACTCGCCEGHDALTPERIYNRPGLSALHRRVGTHATFFETMLSRLSAADYPELAPLQTREAGDFSIGLLDAWATVADVLTFYQERIANEGYLRTATERRSLVELARLVGYRPRPGVAASVYLAFELDKEATPLTIPMGSKANSVPAAGETMEAFETADPILARREWSKIKPRLNVPQTFQSVEAGLYLKGVATRLKPGDRLLIGTPAEYAARIVRTVEPDHDNDRTKVGLEPTEQKGPPPPPARRGLTEAAFNALATAASVPPRSAAQLTRTIAGTFAAGGDALPKLRALAQPALAGTLYQTLRNAPPPVAQPLEVYAMRVEARPFGHNAPARLVSVERDKIPEYGEWDINKPLNGPPPDPVIGLAAAVAAAAKFHQPRVLFLDNDYEIAAGSKVIIEGAERKRKDSGGEVRETFTNILKDAVQFDHVSLSAYGLSGKSVRINWTRDKDDEKNAEPPWLLADSPFDIIRGARVFAGSERLELVDAPWTDDVAGAELELDSVYEGLDPGRWLIVEGERTDVKDESDKPIPGIQATELVMLSQVRQALRTAVQSPGDLKPLAASTEEPPPPPPLPGETLRTVINVAAGLAYTYKRDTVTIYGNVAKATHGETRAETLGSGDATKPLQAFKLNQFPLTYVSAQTPTGVASTLEVRVNDVLWHEAATLAALGADDRSYVTRTDDQDRTTVVFGDGRHGRRLPTGRENVKAKLRAGIGKAGNVRARQISLLASRPSGVKDVINPIRASGGADREGLSSIRRNAPAALQALDRLLSTSDYADFARSFGGVGKAAARRSRAGVEVIIAGVDGAPLDPSSDVVRNLKDALHHFGDDQVPIRLSVARIRNLVLKAGVRLDPDFLWEAVEPKIRTALLDAFSFEAQELGGPVFLSQAQRAIQGVKGVVFVDVDVFDRLAPELAPVGDDGQAGLADLLTKAQARVDVGPDEVAYLPPQIPELLILQELPA